MTVILGILAALLVSSLVISGVFYSRQQAIAKRDAQIKKYQQKADELSVLLTTLLKYDPKFELVNLLHSQILNALQNAFALNPKDPQLAELVANHRVLSGNLKNGIRPNEVITAVESDDALSGIYFHFVQITKVIEMMAHGGKMSRAKCDELSDYLKEVKLELEVNSHIVQAEIFGQNGDFLQYQTHLKQAMEALKKTPLQIEGKNERIKELSERVQAAKAHKRIVVTSEPQLHKKQAKEADKGNSPDNESESEPAAEADTKKKF